jgi:acetyl-CoA carboxylase carboxyl transferase subunit alpha
MTSKYLKQFGIIDDIIMEPLGGAHRDHREMAATLKAYLTKSIRELSKFSHEELLENRYQKFRKIGLYTEELPEVRPETD